MHLRALPLPVSCLVALALSGCTSDLPAPDLYPIPDDGGADDTSQPGELAVECGELPQAAVDASFVFSPEVMGGDGVYRFEANDLPPGLAISETTGQVTGVPTSEGELAFEIVVTDGTGATGRDTCEVSINPGLSVDLALDAVPHCATGNETLRDFVVDGTGDGTPIRCEHVAGQGNGKTPEGISVDPESCAIVGSVTEERLGTWAFMVRGTQSGAEVWLPYCATRDEGLDYDILVEHTTSGTDNTLVPLMRTYDPAATLDVGGDGDPSFRITHPPACGGSSCYYGYAYSINSSPFDVDTIAFGNAALFHDPVSDAPIGFTHELSVGGPAVGESFRARPWVVNLDIDYCLSSDTDTCTGVENIRTNGAGNLEFSIIMVPE